MFLSLDSPIFFWALAVFGLLLCHGVCVCLSLIRPPYTGGRGGTLVSGCFLKNEFDGGLTCVGFCMEMFGNVWKRCLQLLCVRG